MKKLLVLLGVIGVACAAQAELLIGFDVVGLPGSGPSVTSVYHAANIETGSLLTRGAGLTNAAATNSFSASGWTVGLTADDANAAGDFFTFRITASDGYYAVLTNIQWRFSRSGTGPTNIALRSSLDGFVSDLAVWTVTGTSALNLTNALSLAPATSVTLRLIGYQAGAGTGTARVMDGANFGEPNIDLAVFGYTTPIPEPGTLAMIGLGAMMLAVRRRFIR